MRWPWIVAALAATSLASEASADWNTVYAVEDAVVARASMCPGAKAPDKDLLRALYRLEAEHGVPPSMRGMSLAAACVESGFNPRARGDWRGVKRGFMAVGLFQQWPWWVASYHVDRTDPLAAADAWLAHVARQVPKVRRTCGPQSIERTWVIAWVTAVRAPKKGGRCGQSPLHWPVLVQWRRDWRWVLPTA